MSAEPKHDIAYHKGRSQAEIAKLATQTLDTLSRERDYPRVHIAQIHATLALVETEIRGSG
jgi:hypothetical protein